MVDSGDAGIDPLVERELDGWLAVAADRMHVFLTHFPPLDPIGVRHDSVTPTRGAARIFRPAGRGRDMAGPCVASAPAPSS